MFNSPIKIGILTMQTPFGHLDKGKWPHTDQPVFTAVTIYPAPVTCLWIFSGFHAHMIQMYKKHIQAKGRKSWVATHTTVMMVTSPLTLTAGSSSLSQSQSYNRGRNWHRRAQEATVIALASLWQQSGAAKVNQILC